MPLGNLRNYCLNVSILSYDQLLKVLGVSDLDRFCIIEGPETVEDFAKMELQEIRDNITSRRNKIFLHMEEVCLSSFSHIY